MHTVREDIIHYFVRRYLKDANWQLVAGQFPDGSDDELPPLNVVDPLLACDNSPDHRRHSLNKFVPDLVACKRNLMLIIEMKPKYSLKDELKLMDLIFNRHDELFSALNNLVTIRGVVLPVELCQLTFIPCLGFSKSSGYKINDRFCYFLVDESYQVFFVGNSIVQNV